MATMSPSDVDVTTEPKRVEVDAPRGDRSLRVAPFAVPLILLAFVVLFSALRPDTFFTTNNLTTLITTQSVLAILSIALVLPLVVGEFDLSVGANLGVGLVLIAGLPGKTGLPLSVALVLTIGACTAVGLVNGLLVARAGINSLVATLGTSTILSGLVLWYTGGNTLFDGFPQPVADAVQGSVLGIPAPGVALLVVAAVTWFVLEQTPRGRFLHAAGASKEASRLAGLDVSSLTLSAFTAGGFLAGVAGIIQAGLLGSGNPNVGQSLLLPAFASVFLGATTIRMGVFNVLGTVVAVFTIAAGITGLQLLGVPFFISPIFQGVALLLAVASVRVLRREAI